MFRPHEAVEGKNRNSFNISASVCFVFFACVCVLGVHACSIVNLEGFEIWSLNVSLRVLKPDPSPIPKF